MRGDLKSYTGTRTALLTYRPAPVPVGFLGYDGTAGGSPCDHLVSARFVKQHESPRPIPICRLGADQIVLNPNQGTQPIEQARWLRR
jgi:hypothetical protein